MVQKAIFLFGGISGIMCLRLGRGIFCRGGIGGCILFGGEEFVGLVKMVVAGQGGDEPGNLVDGGGCLG